MKLGTYTRTPEWKAAKAAQVRQYYIDHPELRAQLAQKAKEQFALKGHPSTGSVTPLEEKERARASRKAFYQTPEGMAVRKRLSDMRKASKGARVCSEETKHKMSIKRKQNWENPVYRALKTAQGRTLLASGKLMSANRGKGGYRNDIGHFVRSRLEANYARILNYTAEPYEYEGKSFKLSTGHYYVPDFYLVNSDTYIETKGFLTDKDKAKYDQFKADYPQVKWVLLKQDSLEWKALVSKYANCIPMWEGTK